MQRGMMNNFFENIMQGLSEAADFAEGKGKAIVHYRTQGEDAADRIFLYKQLTEKEINAVEGKIPVGRDEADRIIEKIEDIRVWKGFCDLDDAAAELAGGMYVIPSDGKDINFRMRDACKRSLELGRPLTDEEFEEFRICSTEDVKDD